MKSLHETFQMRVQQHLEREGLSRADLARALGVSRTRISQVIDGDRVARLDLVERVAKALGVPPWKLLQ